MEKQYLISHDELSWYLGIVAPRIDEHNRRLFMSAMAKILGHGGIKIVSGITGISQPTLTKGRRECVELVSDPKARSSISELSAERVRKEGGGRKSAKEQYPGLMDALDALMDGFVVGNPENPLRWSTKSTYTLSLLLKDQGYKICPNTVASALKEMGFSLQQNRKYIQKGESSPDRNAQFQFINDQCKHFLSETCPVISVDTKKKELVGNFKNNGAEYRPKGEPRKVNDHDFIEEGGRVAPYGVYDIGANQGFVNLGTSADTAEFAVEGIRRWWEHSGLKRYPEARKLMITADCGGSNGYRTRLWKTSLQTLANETGLSIHVSHFPPGTSKWNKIEHLLFAQITRCWRGQPLETVDLIVSLIQATTTSTGLRVACQVDRNTYERGKKVSDGELAAVNIERQDWHGEWNYIIHPQQRAS